MNNTNDFFELSKKSTTFIKFAKELVRHIENYVIPQYGDEPDEHINGMSMEEMKGKLSSYVQRIGKVQVHRGIEGAMQDCFKIAHFAQYVYAKLEEEMEKQNGEK